MNYLLITNIAVMAIINLAFFFLYERTKPKAEEILQLVVIVTIASLGRVVFAVIPQVQPVTCMVIIAGYVYGCRRGYVTGALCALVSNMFLGQGPWTLFQMTGWGVVGLLAGAIGHAVKRREGMKETKVSEEEPSFAVKEGALEEANACDKGGGASPKLKVDEKSRRHTLFMVVYSVVAAYIFSFIVDLLSICYISGALTPASVVAVFAAGFAFQTGHAIFNGIFMALFFKKLVRRLVRARG